MHMGIHYSGANLAVCPVAGWRGRWIVGCTVEGRREVVAGAVSRRVPLRRLPRLWHAARVQVQDLACEHLPADKWGVPCQAGRYVGADGGGASPAHDRRACGGLLATPPPWRSSGRGPRACTSIPVALSRPRADAPARPPNRAARTHFDRLAPAHCLLRRASSPPVPSCALRAGPLSPRRLPAPSTRA